MKERLDHFSGIRNKEDVDNEFIEAGFHLPDMKYPLRNNSRIVQFAMDNNISDDNLRSEGFTASLHFDWTISENLPKGPEVYKIGPGELQPSIQKSFTKYLMNPRVLVILEQELCEDPDFVTRVVEEIASVRERTPLIHEHMMADTSERIVQYLMPYQEFEAWMSNPERVEGT